MSPCPPPASLTPEEMESLIQGLTRALASGLKSTTYRGPDGEHAVSYQSAEEMRQTLRDLQAQLAAARSPHCAAPTFTRGAFVR